MRIIKILGFLLAMFYLIININCYDRRPKRAMVYRNLDGNFQTAELFPEGQGDFSNVVKHFEEFKFQNNQSNQKLYRTFSPNWLYWYYHLEYLIHPRWKLEYLPMVNKGDGKK